MKPLYQHHVRGNEQGASIHWTFFLWIFASCNAILTHLSLFEKFCPLLEISKPNYAFILSGILCEFRCGLNELH